MTRSLRIFLDANILFSAAKSDGAIQTLVAALLDAGHECWVDGYVIDEARRNISVKASSRLPRLDELLSRMHVSPYSPAIHRANIDGLPDKDRVVVAAAIALACEILVTGDRTHFGQFYGRRIAGVRIHSPRSLFDHLFSKS
ncbi:MAG: PIN domain-containing protein [Pirellulales bacterium]